MTAATPARLLTRGLRLEYVTVGWNIVEGVIAVRAGMAAGSSSGAMATPRRARLATLMTSDGMRSTASIQVSALSELRALELGVD